MIRTGHMPIGAQNYTVSKRPTQTRLRLCKRVNVIVFARNNELLRTALLSNRDCLVIKIAQTSADLTIENAGPSLFLINCSDAVYQQRLPSRCVAFGSLRVSNRRDSVNLRIISRAQRVLQPETPGGFASSCISARHHQDRLHDWAVPPRPAA